MILSHLDEADRDVSTFGPFYKVQYVCGIVQALDDDDVELDMGDAHR